MIRAIETLIAIAAFFIVFVTFWTEFWNRRRARNLRNLDRNNG